ncbi:unnamed protein product [marine sediment metagenome]|uniref:PqqD family protein n=1 Tax=marine sediment metagenome TaxID=412755 RepID=X1PHA4_9ZZZZ
MKKIKRKGRLEKTEAGGHLLVNEKGQTFKASEISVSIWDKCDGTVTFEDLANDMRREINLIVRGMEKSGLLEIAE